MAKYQSCKVVKLKKNKLRVSVVSHVRKTKMTLSNDTPDTIVHISFKKPLSYTHRSSNKEEKNSATYLCWTLKNFK